MADAGRASVDVVGDFGSINKQIAAMFSGSKWSKHGKIAGAGIAAGIAAAGVGKALFEIGEQFDDATDKIRVGTGKTGKQLERLKVSFKEVIKDVPADFDSASSAITGLNQRLGLTGKPLERLSKQLTELSRITETDVETNVSSVTRAFGDWEVATGKQSKTLDFFFRASQRSGASVSDLANQVVQFGAPLRQVGFTLEESTAMFAQFEKAGVNTTTMMPGLRMALKSFVSEGLNPVKALRDTFEGVETGAIDAADAATIFGTRAANDMVEAIKQGRFDLDNFTRSIARGSDTIRDAGRDTRDFGEEWTLFKNNILVDLEPLATRVFEGVGNAMKDVRKVLTDDSLSRDEKISKVLEMVGEGFADLAGEAAEAAPKVIGAFAEGIAKSWSELNPLARLFLAGAVINTIGRTKILQAGAAVGGLLGSGVAAGATGTAVGGAAAGAGGGLLASMRSKLLPVAKRVGLVGIGAALADGLIREFQRRSEEKSTDMLTALHAKSTTAVPLFGDIGVGEEGLLNKLTGWNPLEKESERAAKELQPLVEEILKDQRATTVASEIHARQLAKSAEFTDAQKVALEKILILGGQRRRQQEAFLKLGQVVDVDAPLADSTMKKLEAMRRGVFTKMRQIRGAIGSASDDIAEKMGKGSEEGRRAMAANFTAAARNVEAMMRRKEISVEKGEEMISNLIRRSQVITASKDQAEGFAREWAKGMDRSKEFTGRGVEKIFSELKRMPKESREVAAQTWLAQLRQAAQSNPKLKDEFRSLRAKVADEFAIIESTSKHEGKKTGKNLDKLGDGVWGLSQKFLGAFGSSDEAARNAFESIFSNLGKALKGLGESKVPTVALGAMKAVKSVAQGVGNIFDGKQRGGMLTGGKPSGDSIPIIAERDEYMLNREAVKFFGKDYLDAVNFGLAPRFQRGGSTGFPELAPAARSLADQLAAKGFTPTDTRAPRAGSSYHPSGQAIDYGDSLNDLRALWRILRPRASQFAELFGPTYLSPPTLMHNGSEFSDPKLQAGHQDHIHVAILSAIAEIFKMPNLGAKIGGPPGPLRNIAQHAADRVTKAARSYLERAIPRGGDMEIGASGLAGGNAANRALGQRLAARFGWNAGAQWSALDDLWGRLEGRWDENLANMEGSGAYGIAQALPSSKYPAAGQPGAPAGPEKAAAQIRWGLNYIKERYGDPIAAHAFRIANGWYREGGLIGLQKGGDGKGPRGKPALTPALAAAIGKITSLTGDIGAFSEEEQIKSRLFAFAEPESEGGVELSGAERNELLRLNSRLLELWQEKAEALRPLVGKLVGRQGILTDQAAGFREMAKTLKPKIKRLKKEQADLEATVAMIRKRVERLDSDVDEKQGRMKEIDRAIERNRRILARKDTGKGVRKEATRELERNLKRRAELAGPLGDDLRELEWFKASLKKHHGELRDKRGALKHAEDRRQALTDEARKVGDRVRNRFDIEGMRGQLIEAEGITGKGGEILAVTERLSELRAGATGGSGSPFSGLDVGALQRFAETLRLGAFARDRFGGFFEAGGPLGAGRWGIAGENGPEIIKGPAQVLSATQTAGMFGGPFEAIIPVDIHLPSGEVIRQEVRAELRQRDRAAHQIGIAGVS